jgi:hypothetical protein
MSLNESLSFAGTPTEARKAFLGIPDKVFLSPGTRLYKWTDYPLIGSEGNITPWWSYVVKTTLPSGIVAEGFRASEDAAHRLGVSHRAYQKVRGAVSNKFNNNLEHLLLIELKIGGWGFAGRTSGQPEFKNPSLANVYLIGGKGQLWIPNLTSLHVREILSVG